ncbi:MAG: hypothetical protein CBE27_001485 [Pelagibacteraceae bacterium TMED267]|nr:MAG: hypothetical protein CBE27_001485 [Pelagibacteraceae bacterium TMED267]
MPTASVNCIHVPRTIIPQKIDDIILPNIVGSSPDAGTRVPTAILNPSHINIADATNAKALPILNELKMDHI